MVLYIYHLFTQVPHIAAGGKFVIVCLSVFVSVCVWLCLFVCVCVCVCLSVCLSVLSVSVTVC